jgi:copper chaperone CopZ
MTAAKTPMSAVLTVPVVPDSGIRCAGCVTRVCGEIESLPGVLRVECAAGGSVRVDYDAERTTRDELEAASSRLGAQISGSYSHAAWRVTGLD